MRKTKKCACCASTETTRILHLWGTPSDVYFCAKHLPSWAKDKPIGSFSPIVTFLGERKSFYQIVKSEL